MSQRNTPPSTSYGILRQDQFSSELEETAGQVRRLGFAIVDSGYTRAELSEISEEFEQTRKSYVEKWGETVLKQANEFHTIRAPISHGGPAFLKLVMNENLQAVLKLLIEGKFILNQQNGIINPPNETYNQAFWHRDLPYQHFVSSSPLAINALFCIDDFTLENGATFVLPASHKDKALPSDTYIQKNALQVEAQAGQYILLDCMLFHSGGFNRTEKERRAVNHVFNIPYFKQQINLPRNMKADDLTDGEKEILGFNYEEPASIESYLKSRLPKKD